MRLSRFGTQTAKRLNGRFGQFKPRIRVIETEEINSVVCAGELAIGQKEQRVARHGLIKQLHRLHQIFFRPCAPWNPADKVFASQIRVVSNQICRWRLLDGCFFAR